MHKLLENFTKLFAISRYGTIMENGIFSSGTSIHSKKLD